MRQRPWALHVRVSPLRSFPAICMARGRRNVEILEGIMEQFWHICIAAGGVGVVLALALRFALGK